MYKSVFARQNVQFQNTVCLVFMQNIFLAREDLSWRNPSMRKSLPAAAFAPFAVISVIQLFALCCFYDDDDFDNFISETVIQLFALCCSEDDDDYDNFISAIQLLVLSALYIAHS